MAFSRTMGDCPLIPAPLPPLDGVWEEGGKLYIDEAYYRRLRDDVAMINRTPIDDLVIVSGNLGSGDIPMKNVFSGEVGDQKETIVPPQGGTGAAALTKGIDEAWAKMYASGSLYPLPAAMTRSSAAPEGEKLAAPIVPAPTATTKPPTPPGSLAWATAVAEADRMFGGESPPPLGIVPAPKTENPKGTPAMTFDEAWKALESFGPTRLLPPGVKLEPVTPTPRVVFLEVDRHYSVHEKERTALVEEMRKVGITAVIVPAGLKVVDTPVATKAAPDTTAKILDRVLSMDMKDRVTFTATYEGYTLTVEGSLDRPEVKAAWVASMPKAEAEESPKVDMSWIDRVAGSSFPVPPKDSPSGVSVRAIDFLFRLGKTGGSIRLAGSLSVSDLSRAKTDGRYFDDGMTRNGFVIVPDDAGVLTIDERRAMTRQTATNAKATEFLRRLDGGGFAIISGDYCPGDEYTIALDEDRCFKVDDAEYVLWPTRKESGHV